jgi:hypothetical protein
MGPRFSQNQRCPFVRHMAVTKTSLPRRDATVTVLADHEQRVGMLTGGDEGLWFADLDPAGACSGGCLHFALLRRSVCKLAAIPFSIVCAAAPSRLHIISDAACPL